MTRNHELPAKLSITFNRSPYTFNTVKHSNGQLGKQAEQLAQVPELQFWGEIQRRFDMVLFPAEVTVQ